MKDKLKNISRPIYSPIVDFFLFQSRFLKYYKSQQLTSIQKEFINELSFFKPSVPKEEEKGILLIQYLKDYEYNIKFAAAAKTYAQANKLKVCFYDVNWSRWLGFGNKAEFFFNKHFSSANRQIHRAFGGEVIYKVE